jgi:hypothetical protein
LVFRWDVRKQGTNPEVDLAEALIDLAEELMDQGK